MALYQEVISPLPCLGNLGFFVALIKEDLIIDIHEHYQKQSLRNRYELTGPQGRFHLTVPVEGQKGKKVATKDIRISYDMNWRQQHLRAIRSNYGSSPFYEHYADCMMPLYEERHDFLVDFSLSAHDKLCQSLGLSAHRSDQGLNISETYIKSTPGRDLRIGFKSTELEVEPYTQVFEDRQVFQHNLSALDLLFCCGPTSRLILNRTDISRL